MKNFNFYYDKRKTIVEVDGKFYKTNGDYSNRKFTETQPVKIKMDSFLITADSLDNAYTEFINYRNKERQSKKEEKAEKLRWAENVRYNMHKYTVEEILEAALIINSQPGSGWQGADMLLADSAFSKAVLKHTGNYSVTPFNNGCLMVKLANGKRYSNKRGHADISDLLREKQKTVHVSLSKIGKHIDDQTFDFLTSLFEKFKPSVLYVSKEQAKKIISREYPTETSGQVPLYSDWNLFISTGFAIAEMEYYAKKYDLEFSI